MVSSQLISGGRAAGTNAWYRLQSSMNIHDSGIANYRCHLDMAVQLHRNFDIQSLGRLFRDLGQCSR